MEQYDALAKGYFKSDYFKVYQITIGVFIIFSFPVEAWILSQFITKRGV